MPGTRAIRVSPGVYEALKVMAERTESDISSAASLFILATLLNGDGYKSLPPEVQGALAADLMEFLSFAFKHGAEGLRSGRVSIDELQGILEAKGRREG